MTVGYSTRKQMLQLYHQKIAAVENTKETSD
jgi:hypothetical protein